VNGPRYPRPGDDLLFRLELVDEALLAIAGNVANGRTPDDEAVRDRCRQVAERIAAKGRGVTDQLARPPRAGLEARVVAEQDRILAECHDREHGEEP
jgi:hypothetical protein